METKLKDLVIIGAGGFGREMILHVNEEANKHKLEWNLIGFVDEEQTGEVEGYKILGNLETFLKMEEKPYFFIAIANSEARERIAKQCKAAGFPAATIYCGGMNAMLAPNAEIGEGCYIGRNCAIMNEVKIGPFCIIQGRSLFGHDTTVGEYTSIMTDASFGGETHVGPHCYFGLRCTVINRINITDHCTFGACACVVKDAAQSGTYVGVPAKLIKPLQK